MNKIVCMGLICMIGASIVAGEAPKSGSQSLHSSAELLRKNMESLRNSKESLSSSGPIAIRAAAKRNAKRDGETSSSYSRSTGSSPAGVYLNPGQTGLGLHVCPIDERDHNMGAWWHHG